MVYTALVVRQGRYGVVLYGVYSPSSETGPLWCGAVWCIHYTALVVRQGRYDVVQCSSPGTACCGLVSRSGQVSWVTGRMS